MWGEGKGQPGSRARGGVGGVRAGNWEQAFRRGSGVLEVGWIQAHPWLCYQTQGGSRQTTNTPLVVKA